MPISATFKNAVEVTPQLTPGPAASQVVGHEEVRHSWAGMAAGSLENWLRVRKTSGSREETLQ